MHDVGGTSAGGYSRRAFIQTGIAAAGALALGFKAPNLMVVVAVAGYLVLRAVMARRRKGPGDCPSDFRSPREYLRAAASLLAGGAAAAAAWVAVRAAIALHGVWSPIVEAQTVDSLQFGKFAENVGRFITVWDDVGSKSYPLAVITSYVLIGSLLAAVVALSPSDRRHALAVVTGAMVVVGPLVLVLTTYVSSSSYFLVQPRYGTSLVPLQAAIAASLWRTRAALLAVAGLAVAYQGAVLFVVLRR